MKVALMEYETIDSEQVKDLMNRQPVRLPASWDDKNGGSPASSNKEKEVEEADLGKDNDADDNTEENVCVDIAELIPSLSSFSLPALQLPSSCSNPRCPATHPPYPPSSASAWPPARRRRTTASWRRRTTSGRCSSRAPTARCGCTAQRAARGAYTYMSKASRANAATTLGNLCKPLALHGNPHGRQVGHAANRQTT